MVTILLELSPGSKLVVKGVSYIFKASEGVIREGIEPIISGSLEAGRECQTEKELIVSIEGHLVLELVEM